MDNWNGTNYDKYYDDEWYADDYGDEWEDDYDYHDDYHDNPVPLLIRIKHWLIALWWRIREKLGLPTPYDDIPF